MTIQLDDRILWGVTTLSAQLSAGATSMTISDATKLPVPTVAYNCGIYDGSTYSTPADDPNAEVVRVTGGSGNTRNITRAQEGTSDVLHGNGSVVYAIDSPKMYDDIESHLQTLDHTVQLIESYHEIDLAGTATDQFIQFPTNGLTMYPVAKRAGSFIGISAGATGTITGGTITVEAWNGSTQTGFTVQLDSANQSNYATQAPGTDTFNAGERLFMKWTTASLTPATTIDIVAGLELYIPN